MNIQNKILVVANDQDNTAALIQQFLNSEAAVLQATDGMDALKKVSSFNPDLILLDVEVPGLNGIEVKAELNKNKLTAKIPVIFLVAQDKIDGLKLRADDYVTKPYNWEELKARIHALLYKQSFYYQPSLRDDLTGLPNAEFFKTQLTAVFDIAKNYGRVFSLAVLDINNFKIINDRFGRQTGDHVLRETAHLIRSQIRKPDILARYANDEFVVLFSECDLSKAAYPVLRIQESFEESPIHLTELKGTISVSLNVGVAAYRPQFSTPEELLALAILNMTQDKQTQKNRLPAINQK